MITLDGSEVISVRLRQSDFATASSTVRVVFVCTNERSQSVLRTSTNIVVTNDYAEVETASIQSPFPVGKLEAINFEILSGFVPDRPGIMYGSCDLIRAGRTLARARGYEYRLHDIMWPWGGQEGPFDGPGNPRTITGTNPAAGAEVTETVDTGAAWELLSFSAVLVADANAANRVPRLAIDDGAATNRRYVATDDAGNPITANQTRTAMWCRGPHLPGTTGAATQAFVDTQTLRLNYSLQEDLGLLTEGMRIRTVTSGILAGDDYAAPIFQVEEYIAP